MKMPEISSEKLRHFHVERRSLEVELHRKLDYSRIKRVSDLPECGAGDGLILSREEVRVIENIEELRTKFNVGAFRNSGPLDHTEIDIPEARSAYGSQVESTGGARQRMTKELGICTSVGTNQPWIKDQWTTGDGIEEKTHAVLQLLDTQRGSRRIFTRSR